MVRRSATPSASPRPSDAPGRAATPVGGTARAQSRSLAVRRKPATSRAGIVKLIESDAFSALGLAPSLLVMVHVKDPRVLPSRAYFDNFYRWHNVSAVHVPSQMAMGADYRRLYGACNHQVLALSSAYAAFEGFESGTDDAAWFEGVLPRAVWSDRPAVSAAVGKLVARLRRDTGKFSCLHLADLDAAVLTARGPEAGAAASSSTFSSAASSVAASSRLADMNDADGGRLLDVDIAAPAARSFGYGGPVGGGGGGASACDGYDAEAQTDSGRAWVRSAYDSGYSCHLDDATVVRNLPRLPPGTPSSSSPMGCAPSRHPSPKARARRSARSLCASANWPWTV